jgi:hypothetical protein
MLRNVLIAVTAAVLLGAISLLAAEKVKEKKAKEKMEQQQAYEQPKAGKGLLDELIAAYQANDREKMGQIIQKMEQRREKMQKFAKLNRWHRWAHRRWAMEGAGWGQGRAMQGQGWNQGCPMAGPQWGQGQAMRGCCRGPCGGMGNCQAMAGGFGQMPCPQGGMNMDAWAPQQGGPGQMPGRGRGFQQNWTQGPDAENTGPQEWNGPRRERPMNVPPPEWGW